MADVIPMSPKHLTDLSERNCSCHVSSICITIAPSESSGETGSAKMGCRIFPNIGTWVSSDANFCIKCPATEAVSHVSA